MMGQPQKTESLFYYFRLEDHIPENHLRRLIDRYVDFSFVRERLKDFYSQVGRPSIDPEVLLRLLLVGYLYGITSERRLMEEVRMHLAYRWFTRLDFDQEIPDHSTFSKNRHGRFRQSGVFREVFEEIVQLCLGAGLVEGRHLTVDGTLVEADAGPKSRVPREQLAERAQVSRTVRNISRSWSSKTRWEAPESLPPFRPRLARARFRPPIRMRPGDTSTGCLPWATTTTI